MDSSNLIQALPNFLMNHKGVISLLSMAVSLSFALVVFSLSKRFNVLQEEKWVKRFAWAFLVLAVMFSVRSLMWLMMALGYTNPPRYITYSAAVSVAVCSSLSNYFFFGVGFPLARKSRRLRDKTLQLLHLKPAVGKYLVYVLLFIVALISANDALKNVLWTRIPDVSLSALALVFVGIALYRNISFRRGPFMARLALITAIGYAFLHLSYGFHPLIAHQGWADWLVGSQEVLEIKITKMDLIAFSIALILKLGLFYPGYTLMLMIANPTGEVRRLLKSVTHESAEFLDDDGVVRSIREEIQASRVELYIKLPGTERDTVGCYRYPAKNYATTRPEEAEFDRFTDYGYVMSTGDDLLFRLVNYSDQIPEYLRGKLSAHSSIIAMPIFFHNGVIGCLKAELDVGKFTEADMQNIHRCAALLSPAVQDYREVDALNEISHRLTRLQIETIGYDIQDAANGIVKVAHDILAPLATGISIEAGFCEYKAFLPQNDHYGARMKDQLDTAFDEHIPTSATENLTWLPKKLKITSNELIRKLRITSNESKRNDGADDEQFLGKLILAAYKKLDQTNPPTLATNFFHRRVVSNLITEVLLNFVRGYLNEVTKHLGIALSGLSEAKIAHWFVSVAAAAKRADLSWAVATQPNSPELLGQETFLVQNLEKVGRWEKKNTREFYSNLEVWLCTLEPGQMQTSHVIKILLRETRQTLWLGVANPKFERELDYMSPWAAFILRFGEIADTALQRILNKQQRENFEKEAADFHGLSTTAIVTGTVIHQMVNQVRDLTSPLTTLEEAIKFGGLKGNERHKKLIFSLSKSASQIEELTKLFSGITKPDDRRPCSLREATQYAFNLLQDSLTRYDIQIDLQVSPSLIVDVPFYVAAFALANLLNNGKDAIRDGKVREGTIQIRAAEMETGKMILVHVTDNGPGVPNRLIGHLFQSSGKSDKPHGSGLGLYLSARSLREARGDIKLTNPGPTPPTTFTVYFPKPRKD
jgi:signal transduction histidine kinase